MMDDLQELCNSIFNELPLASKKKMLEAIKQSLIMVYNIDNDTLNELWKQANTCSVCHCVNSCECKKKK
jgi:hypothetical protein